LASTDSGKGADLLGYAPPGTGSVGRTVFSVLRERRRLTDKLTTAEIDDILSGTGSINISTQFATAVSDAAGKVLLLPEGRIKAEGMTVLGAKSAIVGAGGFATRISAPSAASTVFTVSSEFIEMLDLWIDSSTTRSGGWYMDFTAGANRSSLRRFYMDGFHGGLRTAAAATMNIESGVILNGIAATATAIRVNDGFDVSIRDVILDSAADILAGVYVRKVGDLTIEDCNLIHAGQAVYLNPQAGEVVSSVWVNNSFLDTSNRGLNAFAQAGSIRRCVFDQVWFGSNQLQGALLQSSGGGSIDGMYFHGCEFYLNGLSGTGDGLLVNDAGCINTHIRDGSIAGNAQAGLSFAANVGEFSVLGVRVGNPDGLAGNNVGINISAGTGGNFTLQNNDMRGNVTVSLVDGATGAGKLIADNTGWGTGSAVYDPPNLADGTGVTTTVTVSQAAVGDMPEVSFSNSLQGIQLTAFVSAADTVSVRFQNETGGAIDLASGTLRARVKRST
jgi:hypothetical protein